jgi:hypothetical protein
MKKQNLEVEYNDGHMMRRENAACTRSFPMEKSAVPQPREDVTSLHRSGNTVGMRSGQLQSMSWRRVLKRPERDRCNGEPILQKKKLAATSFLFPAKIQL